MSSSTALTLGQFAMPSASGSIEAYIQAANRVPMLLDAEEGALARRFRDDGDLDAARQLITSHLRLVIAIIKVNRDLERIGDEAAKVAKQAVRVSEDGMSPSSFIELRHIGTLVGVMLRQALDAFARLDVEQAVGVVRGDAEVDKEYGSAMRSLVTFMVEDPRNIGVILNEMWALRSLERIGDHACNIAEHVVYLVQGLDVRHGGLDELGDLGDLMLMVTSKTVW